eukprot:snap_masked-scaffold_1-processed-gene-31.27-mRNA-1 protein AED:0.04 eAED:0.04 QI:120/1/1/1/0.4/0.33/6/123/376
MSLGWFTDPAEIKLELDSEFNSARHALWFGKDTPLYESNGKVKGRVKVTLKASNPVWHYGVILELESSLSFVETMNGYGGVMYTHQVLPEGYLEEDKVVEFEIDLKQIKSEQEDKFTLFDSYFGDLFSISHGLTVTMKRPWYTFDILDYSNILFLTVDPAPTFTSSDDPTILEHPYLKKLIETNSEVNKQKDEGDTGEFVFSSNLVLADFPGKMKLDHKKFCYNVGEEVELELVLKAHQIGVKKVSIVFYKVETGEEEMNEVIIKEQDIEKDLLPKVRPPTGCTDAEISDLAIEDEASEPIKVLFKFGMGKDALAADFVANSLMQTFNGEEFISIKHYIRFYCEDNNGTKYWNTNEIVIFRNKLERTVVKTAAENV